MAAMGRPTRFEPEIFCPRHRRRETWGDRGPASVNDSYNLVALLEAASERARHEAIPSCGEIP